MKRSPPLEYFVALRTNLTASGILNTKRVTSGLVRVSGVPFRKQSKKIGITEPLEFTTFPKRTHE